jgi:hypothetical protein
MEVGHDHMMTPIDFEVSGSKVKIIGPKVKKACPLNCLRMLWSTVYIFGIVSYG